MGGIKVVNPMAAAMSELEVDSDSDNDEDVTTVSSNTTATVSNADTNIQQDSDKDSSWCTTIIQLFVTFCFGPAAFFWVFGVITDIIVHWESLRPPCVGILPDGATCQPSYGNYSGTGEKTCQIGCEDRGETSIFSLEFFIMVIAPALSFWASVYMLVQYWMDEDSWTILRKRLMFANIPMCIFFGMVLVGQAENRFSLSCPQMAFVLQVTYLTMNLWQTMTIVTAYRFIILEKGRFKGWQRVLIHLICWGTPVATTTAMFVFDSEVFHEDIFQEADMGYGVGWCGVRSNKRVLKAIFVNTPQLICVSLYAQYYSYIHEKIDPPDDTDPLNRKTQISLSKNAALMGAKAARLAEYQKSLAAQLRSYMTAYMLSFLTNTVLQLVGDNFTIGSPQKWNLLLQAAVVTPQGLMIALVYSRTAPNSISTAYLNILISRLEKSGKMDAASNFRQWRDSNFLSSKAGASKDFTTKISTGIQLLGLTVGEWWTIFLMMPVGIWVWAPMGFLSEFMDRAWTFIGLVIFGIFTVFPFYWFRQEQNIGIENGIITDLNPLWYYGAAQGYLIAVVGITTLAIWKSKFAYHLNMIEGAVRRRGVFSSIGEGIRLNSLRNAMSCFTLNLEFYQTWGLAWNTARMGDRYDLVIEPETESSASGEDAAKGTNNNLYWMSVAMVGGWALLYSLPSVITTVSVANRTVAHNLSEQYRKYLWFMSGAGFLTLLKALMKYLFCVEDPAGRMDTRPGQPGNEIRMVPMGDYSLYCWGPDHLRLASISCVCLVIFFPSASLTCLFRYDDEDNRGCGKKDEDGKLIASGYAPCHGGCVAGGEDIRWIHIWRRVEYLVKFVWVFSAFKFSAYGNFTQMNPGVVFLLAGSFSIVVMNGYMTPCNLSYVGRFKFFIHACNVWTTITCVWAISSDNTDKPLHLTLLFTGWIVICGTVWGYEFFKFKTDTFRQPLGDRKNRKKCSEEIQKCRMTIIASKGLSKWGVHRKITRLIRLAEHPDDDVKKEAMGAIAGLAYQDQMTGASMRMGTSDFLFVTPVYPAVQMFMRAIEGRGNDEGAVIDPETRNYATQALLTYLQANVWNKAFGLRSFYQGVSEYEEEHQEKYGTGVVDIFIDYMAECENSVHQLDAMILLLNFCKVDTNHLVKVCAVALPLLDKWMKTGNMIEQYVALRITLLIAERFDLAQHLIDSGLMSTVIKLYHLCCDQFKKNDLVEGGATGFESVKSGRGTKPLTNEYTVPGHNLPINLKKLFRKTKRRIAGAPPSVAEVVVLKEKHLTAMMRYMMENAMLCVVDCATGVGHAGRRHLIELGALDIMKRSFDFEKGINPDKKLDPEITASLQEVALKASHIFLCGPFADRDIDVDPDYKVFNGMLERFKEQVEDEEEGEILRVLKFDSTLTALQRRKAHIMCEYHNLEHISVGVGIDRQVVATFTDASNSGNTRALSEIESMSKKFDEVVPNYTAIPRPKYYSEGAETNFQNNYRQVGKMDVGRRMIALQQTAQEDSMVMFHVVDIMLLLLEHDMVSGDQRASVRSVMLKAVSSENEGMAVMGATGMEIFCVRDNMYAEFGERRAKYLDNDQGSPLKMFRWAGKMVYWIWFWKIHSGNMGFLTPEEELAEKEEQEIIAKERAKLAKQKADAEFQKQKVAEIKAQLQAQRETENETKDESSSATTAENLSME